MGQSRNDFFKEFERWLLENYTDVLLRHQRSTTVGTPWDEEELPEGVVKRVKHVLRAAREILSEAWHKAPDPELLERCGLSPEAITGRTGHYRKLLCVLANKVEELDNRYHRKNVAALVAASKLHDFAELYLDRLEQAEKAPEEPAPAEERQPAEEAKVERTHKPSPPPPRRREPARPVGRIAPTSRHPAGVGRFPFWAESDADLALGELIVAEGRGPDGQEVRIFAAIEDLRRESSYESPMQHFAAHDLGSAGAEPATEPLFPLVGEAAVIHRSDGRSAPPGGAWPIRPARAREAEEAINKDVDGRWAVPAGLVPLRGEMAVAHYDLRFIAGPEGGHVNISGISGVAAKTSYAVFLLTGLLAQAMRQRQGGGLAAVLFNVKEEDLMHVHVDPETWERALARAEESRGSLLFSARAYRLLRSRFREFDPAELYRLVGAPLLDDGPGVIYLAPQHPERDDPSPFTAVEKAQHGRVKVFQFGLSDLGSKLLSAFDPDDLDEKLEAAVRFLLEQAASSGVNSLAGFEKVIEDALQKARKQKSTEHPLTLQKLLNRWRAIRRDLKGLVADRTRLADPPDLVLLLRSGRVLVFDVTQITERARRVLIGWLIDELERLLMERKALTGGLDTPPPKELPIPARVAVFADELNRFAPKVGRSEVGRILGRVAAQGRSYGLAIVGMQQQASRVNEQILTNSSTLVVGRSHAAELGRGDAYGWMSRGLKDQAADLDKGQVIASHPAWRQPLILRFPLPHHRLVELALEEEDGG